MFPNRYFPARFFADRYWPPGGAEAAIETPITGGHFLPVYEGKRKYRNLRKEAKEAVKRAIKEVRGEVERVEEATGVAVAVPVAAEMRDRLAGLLAEDAPDYLTPLEAARRLVIELIAEQNRQDEEEAMIVIMALGA